MRGRTTLVRHRWDAALAGLVIGCAWIALALPRLVFSADAGLGAPSVLGGAALAFAAAFGICVTERAWARRLELRDASSRAASGSRIGRAERVAFDGSVPLSRERTPRPPELPLPADDRPRRRGAEGLRG